MPLTLLPASFFGAGYSAASHHILLNTVSDDSITAFDTFTAADFVTGVMTLVGTTFATDQYRIPVHLTTATTLPLGLETGVTYYLTVVASSSSFTLRDTLGNLMVPEDGGTGAHSLWHRPSLMEVTDTEADLVTGDWRKVLMGLLEYLWACWKNTETKPDKITVTNSSYRDTTTGEDVTTYTFKVRTLSIGREVSPE